MRQGREQLLNEALSVQSSNNPFPTSRRDWTIQTRDILDLEMLDTEKSKVRYRTKNREINLCNEIPFFIQHQNADRWSFTHTLQSGGSFLKKIISSSKIRKDTDIWQFHSPNFRKSKKCHKYLIPWLIMYIYIIIIMKHSLI